MTWLDDPLLPRVHLSFLIESCPSGVEADDMPTTSRLQLSCTRSHFGKLNENSGVTSQWLQKWRQWGRGTYPSALSHGVPYTTLKDRLSGRVIHGTKPGPITYLNAKEEEALTSHLVEATKVGYGKTRKQVKMIIEKVAQEKGILRSQHISDGWWWRFLERQPQLSLCHGDATAHIRMDSVNR